MKIQRWARASRRRARRGRARAALGLGLALALGLAAWSLLGSEPAVSPAGPAARTTTSAASEPDRTAPAPGRVAPRGDALALGTLRGVVRAGESGRPLAGVTVTARWSDPEAHARTTKTDADGRFALAGLGAGTKELEAAGDYPWEPVRLPVQLLAGVPAEVEVELEARFALEVEVVEAPPPGTEGGEPPRPLDAALVDLRPLPDDLVRASGDDPFALQVGRSDATGRARLVGIPTGTWLLTVSAPQHLELRRVLRFDPAELSAVDHLRRGRLLASLQPAGPLLEGVVLAPDGRGVEGALVCVAPGAAAAESALAGGRIGRPDPAPPALPSLGLTDAAGRFRVACLAPERRQHLVVCPRREGLAIAHALDLRLAVDQPPAPLEVRLPEVAEVTVEVVGTDGRAADGAVALTDGRVRFDLQNDPRLGGIPGIAAGGAVPGAGATLRLPLAVGGYQVYYSPPGAGRPARAFFVQVEDLAPRRFTLLLDG